MMTFEQVAVLLDRMCRNYKIQAAGEPEIDQWHGQIKQCDPKQALATVDRIIASEGFFPTVSKFRDVYASLTPPDMRDLGRKDRDEDCALCSGVMWVEVEPLVVEENVPGRTYEQWKPCRLCNPVGYDRWLEVRKPPLKKPREETYEANPRQWIDAARNAIKNIDDL